MLKILNINSNYIYSGLHKNMLLAMTKGREDSICHKVYGPTWDKTAANVFFDDENIEVNVSACFNKNDRLLYEYKQKKILKDILDIISANPQWQDFDIIHAYTLFTDGNVAKELSKITGKPYVVAARSTDMFFLKYRPWLKTKCNEIIDKSSGVFFLSQAYYDRFLSQYVDSNTLKSASIKSKVIPNGIDDFWHANSYERPEGIMSGAGTAEKPIKLVYAGRIDKNKNIPATLKAIDFLMERGVHAGLTVVGKVDDNQEFERIISNPHVTYIEAKPKEELIDIYRDNHIFVMPSKLESFGLVYAEAMSQGLPVIYSKGQGFDGQFPQGEVGYSVDSSSPEDIAIMIPEIMKDYDRMSKNAVTGSKRYQWGDITKEYISIYNQISGIERGGLNR